MARSSSTTLKKRGGSRDAPLTRAAVTANFLAICREAIERDQRVYVQDRSGTSFLTLDPQRRHLREPIVDVSAQQFKDHIARFSSLIKDGLCFRLRLRRTNQFIYARRNTRYRDPLDSVIDEWREGVATAAQQLERKVLLAIENDGATRDAQILKALEELRRGIARLAIGHRPFEEGMIDPAPAQARH